MSVSSIILIVAAGVALLLLLVLKVRINAFISLLITAIFVGILAGMPLREVTAAIQKGMEETLGFIAVVVGLGAVFGQILESSGGAHALANSLLRRFRHGRASWAMLFTGFIVAIPVFFDVGLIIFIPIIYALGRDTGKSLLYFGIPLLAGLAVAHSFIPPTPGPVAVSEIIGADLGWVIVLGLMLGLPTAVIAGPLFGRFIAGRIKINPPVSVNDAGDVEASRSGLPSFRMVMVLIVTPLLLIVVSTLTGMLVKNGSLSSSTVTEILIFIGHPFSALIIATLLAIWLLGLRRGMSRDRIMSLSTKALGPAGIIILVTGAGGVLKEVLVQSGIGTTLADSVAGTALSPILLAWVIAALVRITQGSATVAMITAAGIVAPILTAFALSDPHRALIVIAISSGATIASHVNDSGFWLVSKYFGMNEKQTLQSWTVMETIIAVCGLVFTLTASLII
ncbi:MAG: gluconate:H+ symporter [Bacteroidales bacterium]|nr:gluconate:H+ symporter [Bacteroidales bacterium]MDT8372960.1 gluconate:H+ symporter [Bacteroidales bacterium]